MGGTWCVPQTIGLGIYRFFLSRITGMERFAAWRKMEMAEAKVALLSVRRWAKGVGVYLGYSRSVWPLLSAICPWRVRSFRCGPTAPRWGAGLQGKIHGDSSSSNHSSRSATRSSSRRDTTRSASHKVSAGCVVETAMTRAPADRAAAIPA